MTVERVSLKNVRNYGEINVGLSGGANIFYGENAQGKTNFLESVYFCAAGRSHRTNCDKDLIKFNEPSAHIKVSVKTENGFTETIAAHIKKDSGKGMAVNGVPVKKLSDLLGTLLVVIFSPEDLTLVKAGPSERRRYVDMELCQLSKVYCHSLTQYHKALKQRNALLKEIQRNRESETSLFVWNAQLADYGAKIINRRAEFVKKLSDSAGKVHCGVTGDRERLSVIYKPDVTPEEFEEKLAKNAKRDVMTGSTSRGAHKDEIIFLINNENARIYGSQGQQRTASISAKLAEIEVITEEKRVTPVLMLDDVFSELDDGRAGRLVEKIGGVQSIVTCTGLEDALARLKSGGAALYNVSGGNVIEAG